MSVVAPELSELVILWAVVLVGVWTSRMDLEIEPEPVSISPSCMIVNELVVRVGDPETCGGGVSVQKTHTPLRHHDQIVGNVILCLNAVLNENSVALHIVSKVVGDPQELIAMDCECSVE